MPVMQPTPKERREIEAEMAAEEPQIAAAVEQVFAILRTVSPLAQKQVLCRATATWVAIVDPERAYELSEQMRVQTDVYLESALMGSNKRRRGH